MTLLQKPGVLTLTNGPAPAGALRLDVTEQDLEIAAYMEHIHFWGGAWQAKYAGPLLSQRVWSGGAERVATAVSPRIASGTIAGRSAWAFEDHQDARLNIPEATVPLSHTIYAAFQIDINDTIGLFGNSDGTGARLFLRADGGGALRYDHSGAATADIFVEAGKWQLGAPSIVWASYDAITKRARIGGTVGGVAQIETTSSRVLAADHKGGAGYTIGNGLNFFGAHRMGDVIVAATDLPATAPSAHRQIVRSLAQKYGLTAA